MAKPNYAFEKRQRDLAKQKKKQEKLLKKSAIKEAKTQEGSAAEPENAEQTPQGGDSSSA
jgi:peptidoglycan hydrolase CwlO-like protein